MKPEKKRLAILLVVLGLAAVIRIVVWIADRPQPLIPGRTTERRGAKGGPSGGIPEIQVTPMVKITPVAEVGRNIFRFYVPPTPTPTRIPPTPTPFPMPGSRIFIGPMPVTPTPTPTAIVAPNVPYTIVGVFGPKNGLIVTFESSGRLINAREGDVLDGQFILRKVNLESVDIGFTGLPPEIIKRIPVSNR